MHSLIVWLKRLLIFYIEIESIKKQCRREYGYAYNDSVKINVMFNCLDKICI